MDFRKINYDVMNDTVDLCTKLDYLKKSIKDSIDRERIVFQDDKVETESLVPNGNMKIMVSGRRTYEAAEQYKGKKICCLDFANNHNVGGSPSGRIDVQDFNIISLHFCKEERVL